MITFFHFDINTNLVTAKKTVVLPQPHDKVVVVAVVVVAVVVVAVMVVVVIVVVMVVVVIVAVMVVVVIDVVMDVPMVLLLNYLS